MADMRSTTTNVENTFLFSPQVRPTFLGVEARFKLEMRTRSLPFGPSLSQPLVTLHAVDALKPDKKSDV